MKKGRHESHKGKGKGPDALARLVAEPVHRLIGYGEIREGEDIYLALDMKVHDDINPAGRRRRYVSRWQR